MVRPSGPAARELPELRSALTTASGWKGEAEVFRGCERSSCLLTRRV